MTINMTNFAGHKTKGRDYSTALRDMLPEIIGTTPMTMHQIASAAGRDHETVRDIIGKIRSQVHIAAWSIERQKRIDHEDWQAETLRQKQEIEK